MATLVLSTVGTALGGPVGGAIGALIGQSFDREILAPARRGPRLGDLSVQTSSYGTQIPRIYGAMRVAGTIVWATDLVEGDQTTGAKGQPDVTYSYSVSLAVALSSRPGGSIGRIWADGKLLRGVEGDFKVPTTFRFYDGSETQEIDPLIGSIEGIANTPAYRGVAIAVFENLELADFGNRIPFMTFEVIADSEAPTISSILGDASTGVIACDAPQTVIGYAAYGRSVAAAVQPLVDCFDVSLFDDGTLLRGPLDLSPIAISQAEIGSGAETQGTPKLERELQPVRLVPSMLRLSYYDPDRDYQTGEASALAGEQGANEAGQELPAVLSASDAKALAQHLLARQWARRERLTLRLPPSRIGLEPGSIVLTEVAPASWVVEKSTIDGFVTVVEVRRAPSPTMPIIGDAGRIVSNKDVIQAPISLALIDAPLVGAPQAGVPVVRIAASSPNGGWSAKSLALSGEGQVFATKTAARKSVLGATLSSLAPAQPYLVDDTNSVDVQLIDTQQWLTSCDDDAMAEGLNVAIIGSELVQFGEVRPLGEGRFRLARLLRGRGGTEWAIELHSAGELFCRIDSSSLQTMALPIWMRGTALTVADREGANSSTTFTAQSITPLQPDNLAAAWVGGGDLNLSWMRRSIAGCAWLDEVDAPLGESREQYRVKISGTDAVLELVSDATTLSVPAADLMRLGGSIASVEVRQVGDWAMSRPAQLSIDLPQE